MSKHFAIICIFLSLSAVPSLATSGDCSATSALRTLYGLSNSVTTPQTYSDLKYCKSLKNSSVCCTDTDINSFQDKTAALLTNLTSKVATRDTYLKNVQDNVLPGLKTSLASFSSTAGQFATTMAALGGGGFGSNDTSDFTDAIGVFQNASKVITSLSANLKTDYTNYQKSRSSCVVEMVKLQSAAFCMACDPSATSKGYNSFGVDFSISDRVCNRLKDSCVSYIAAAGDQNTLIQASYGAAVITSLNTFMQTFSDPNAFTDANAATTAAKLENFDVSTIFSGIQKPASDLVAPAAPIEDCTSTSCDFVCGDLFYGAMLDQQALVLGGALVDMTSGRRLQQKLTRANNRVLDSGSFDPDADEAGTTVTFEEDPAGTQSSAKFGSLSLGSIMMSMVVMMSAVVLF